MQVPAATEVPVHGRGARSTLGDRPHDEGLAPAGVPGDEHSLDRGAKALLVADPATGIHRHAELGHQPVLGHALEADRDEHELGGDEALAALHRCDGPVGVPDRLDQADVSDLTIAAGIDQLQGGRTEDPLAAFLVGGGDGEHPRVGGPGLVGGALGAGLGMDVDLGHRTGALASSRPEAVRPGVPAADDHDVLPGGMDLVVGEARLAFSPKAAFVTPNASGGHSIDIANYPVQMGETYDYRKMRATREGQYRLELVLVKEAANGTRPLATGEYRPQPHNQTPRDKLVRVTLFGVVDGRDQRLAELDYAEVVDAESFTVPEPLRGNLRLLAAVRFGRARLIDNVGVTV